MVILFLLNCLTIFSAFLLSHKIFSLKDNLTRLIALVIFYLAQIVAIELTLGVLRVLALDNVALLTSVLSLCVLLASRRCRSPVNASSLPLKVFTFSKTTILLASILAGFGIVKICINLVNPPFGWDCLNYHFTFPVEWLKHGNLETPITVFDDPSPTYYPINGSLYFLWLLFPLKNFFLADLGQVPFFILSFLAVYAIGQRLGLSGLRAGYAAALFLIIPNFFKQLQVAYVDVMVAGLFLAATYFLFLLNEDFSWKNVVMFSVSLGLLIGTKTVALVYSSLLIIPFIYILFRTSRSVILGMLALLLVIAFGGFSYLRNWHQTGNPLYPLQVVLLGKNIFKGVLDSSVYRAHFKSVDYSLVKLLFREGLGAQTLFFVLPATLCALPIALFKRIRLDFWKGYFLLLPILIYFLYCFVVPYANTRYLYALLGLGMICGFYSLELLKVPRAIVTFPVVICAVSSMFQLAKRQELAVGVALSIALFFTLKPLWGVIKGFVKNPFRLGVSLILLLAALLMLSRDYDAHEYYRYEKMTKYSGFWPDAVKAWRWMNEHTEGNNIAYAGRPVPLPLYGTHLKNNVFYVSVNKVDPAQLHYFANSHYQWDDDFMSLHKSLEERQNYRGNAEYSVWLGNLKRRNTDFLFVYSLHQTKSVQFPLEDHWARENPGHFQPVFTNSTVHIYKILR